MSTIRLGVNIDHVATLRQARLTRYPDPVQAALMAQDAGADGITLHLREDRRHIQVRDVDLLRECLQVPMNLEMAATEDMVLFAEKICPEHCCLVPEKRAELTTEGGLDLLLQHAQLQNYCERLRAADIEVSLFIDPDPKQIEMAAKLNVPTIELHTGQYADAQNPEQRAHELQRIVNAATMAAELGLIVNAGHGLNYHNVQAIAALAVMNELNIGHAIVARAVFYGFAEAVREMKRLMNEARIQ